jgi:hypothetical protein
MESQRELKSPQATTVSTTGTLSPTETGGGVRASTPPCQAGLNLLSRYRLQNRLNGKLWYGPLALDRYYNDQREATAALQPACLVADYDRACLRQNLKRWVAVR